MIIGVNESTCPRGMTYPNVVNVHIGVDYFREFITEVIRDHE